MYSAPSGKFKKYVDTPRSDQQMGSLVICLPTVHEGGALVARHGGQEVVFDWSMDAAAANKLRWAAIFSDCEHEVVEVTKGHRVTLTYNLYWTKFGGGRMAKEIGCLDQELLPFFETLQKLFECEEFLSDGELSRTMLMEVATDDIRTGGRIGFKCTHGYPHTSRSAIKKHISPTLKGLDMVVFQALRRITGDVAVCAVFDPKKDYYEDEEEDACDSFSDNTEKKSATASWGPKEVMADHGGIGDFVDDFQWQGFERCKVTWLNGSPQKFEELQVATFAVSEVFAY